MRLRRLSMLLPAVSLAAPLAVPLAGPLGQPALAASTSVTTSAKVGSPAPSAVTTPPMFTNPLDLRLPDGTRSESCADPNVIHGQQPGDNGWYLYCTSDPFNGNDRDSNGNLIINLIPQWRSTDLVHWTYEGTAFAQRPSWVAPTAGLWAPDVVYADGHYLLYYTASDTSLPGGGSAIGVATSDSPTGPWVDTGTPAVPPEDNPSSPGARRWVFDPEVISWHGHWYIYYGSYFGGVSVRQLSDDLLTSDPSTEHQITIPNRFEGTNIVQHDGWFYYLGSVTNCCNGPLTGYSIFAGRSRSPLGPFVDRNGNSLLAGRVGGTPVISMNGDRWVGPGHDDVLTDFGGQQWMVFHAVDQNDPYFAGSVGFTKRPVLLDPLDWVDEWPTVRDGKWASDAPLPGPAAQPGERSAYRPTPPKIDTPGAKVVPLWDDFAGSTLSPQWTWVRPPDPSTYQLSDGSLSWQTQAADLYVDSNNASILTEPTPSGDYVVETRVSLDVPPDGCCYNYVQAGLVIYGNDDNFVKLASVSIWETRQTEWAKELSPVPDGYPRYGNSVAGPPGASTWLRIVRRHVGAEERYTAYTSQDGIHWVRAGTWDHSLGSAARIGLVSMGGSGFTARFDYVHVWRLRHAG